MRARAVFPGALLAGALTAGALLVLVLGLSLRGNGPFSLGLGDADGSARLSDGPGAASRVGGREAAPLVSPLTLTGSGGAAGPAAVLVPSPLAGAPRRAITRGRTIATRPQLRAPARRRAPAVAPAPAAPAPAAPTAPAPAARPVATSTPNPVAVKVRGRGKKAAPQPKVPKSRVKPEKPAPPPAVTPDRGPAPGPGPPDDKGPPADKHRVEPPGQATQGVGLDDGTLKRVPGGPKP